METRTVEIGQAVFTVCRMPPAINMLFNSRLAKALDEDDEKETAGEPSMGDPGEDPEAVDDTEPDDDDDTEQRQADMDFWLSRPELHEVLFDMALPACVQEVRTPDKKRWQRRSDKRPAVTTDPAAADAFYLGDLGSAGIWKLCSAVMDFTQAVGATFRSVPETDDSGTSPAVPAGEA